METINIYKKIGIFCSILAMVCAGVIYYFSKNIALSLIFFCGGIINLCANTGIAKK